MIKIDCPILNVLSGNKSLKTPVWLMRQAGRYLPEYRALRQKKENFIDFCLSPDLATEATLQPLRRFDLDAAIVFADILLIPHAYGLNVRFVKDEGPKITPIAPYALEKKNFELDKCSAVFKTIEAIRKKISSSQALIGFSGSFWTLALYMIVGKSPKNEPLLVSKDFIETLESNAPFLEQAIISYIIHQIDAGAQVIQLFDSWAGIIKTEEEFEKYVVMPTMRIVKEIKESRPNVPIIGFPKGIRAHWYQVYKKTTGVDAISFDQNQSLDTIKEIQENFITQGNLDPTTLLKGGEFLIHETQQILNALNPNHERHIMGLGHGILPETPIEHVQLMIQEIRLWDQING